MKNSIYPLLLIWIAFSSCKKSSDDFSKEDIPTNDTASVDKAKPNGQSADQRPDSAIINDNQFSQSTTIKTEKNHDKLAQENFADAKVINSKMKVSKNLEIEFIEKINSSMNKKSSLPGDPNLQIKTSEEAFERINTNLSMASPPEVYAEDENYYYFSGGLTSSRIDDFSSGIRISKNGGTIHVWLPRK